MHNTHIPHIEDLVFLQGFKGLERSVNNLLQLRNILTGNFSDANLTIKWDGSPSIVCGVNPDNNRFFVATKGAFNKQPKLYYTDKDIETEYGSSIIGYVLKQCLKYLPELNIKTVLQGDLLYLQEDLITGIFHGEEYIVFKPNTITYAVPANTNLATMIRQSKLGIVFHTTYVGPTFDSLVATYNVDIGSLHMTPNVWYRDASFTDDGESFFTIEELHHYDDIMKSIVSGMRQISPLVLNKFVTLNKLQVLTLRFINAMIRNNAPLICDVVNLIRYVERQYDDEIISMKHISNKIRKTHEKNEVASYISNHGKHFQLILEVWRLIIEAKNIIFNKLLSTYHDNNIKTFLQTKELIRSTHPEGFVLVDDNGHAIKLVDRREFSFHNFNNDRY